MTDALALGYNKTDNADNL